ncbi:hypothetical protein GX917_01810 [Candidatus Falkowbacteria bacterium]|jgi:hypothetical protein|nr:hypothetical protein [Candidatus Falkowbacteria bacterium]
MAKNLAIISREVFYFFTALIVLSIGLEIIWPNIILAYVNLNYIIVLWLISGLISLINK